MYRDKHLLALAEGQPCLLRISHRCLEEDGSTTVAAHSNSLQHGKGKGIKADDNLTAALCLKCHYEIDQGKNLSKEERQEKWLKAHKNTVALLLVRGEWPSGVPVPEWDA